MKISTKIGVLATYVALCAFNEARLEIMKPGFSWDKVKQEVAKPAEKPHTGLHDLRTDLNLAVSAMTLAGFAFAAGAKKKSPELATV